VYNANDHIVWSVKYRRKVSTLEMEPYLQGLFQEIAEDKGFLVSMVEVGE
jgi:putative transposase